MKRMHEAELETRIKNFLDRKTAEFPELGSPTAIHAAKSHQRDTQPSGLPTSEHRR